MRVLHTSDWHIGRRFKGVDLLDYQRRALEWLIDVIEREHVDVLCVSGDVYDLSVPSAEAIRLFDEMFACLGRLEVDGRPLEVVITPGNHDSAIRLGAGSGLMRPNVHVRCGLDAIARPVTVTRGDDELAVYALPYLDPDTARSGLQLLLGQAGVDYRIPRSHEGVMRAAMELVTRDLAARRAADPHVAAVLMAHAFVSGAAPSDSERGIAVGGVDSVPAGLFSHSGLDYLALGHLHRPQRVNVPDLPVDESVFKLDRTPQARYSGSLLAYSFSESRVPPVEGNGKSVVLFDVADGGVADLRTMDVDSGEPAFVRLDGTVEEILGDLASEHRDDWVSVTVHAAEFPHGLYQKIDDRYTHALEKSIVYERRADTTARRAVDLRKATSEMDVLDQFVRHQLGRGPGEEERKVLESAVEAAHAKHAEHAGEVGSGDAGSSDAIDGGTRKEH
ncbi:metallophosphoesterase family protein [Bifidobacterium stellenboschense]|uniref:Nuclease SbcCD subunit D n=1 Tax=Bifidobacterium stellenboschense TaxID=762211 RepID=A0A087DU77_9BIFI|nr:exonuclease SbcCD subunit D C-terminal domain-containing protein [Bifidobacterium stellenboschense]KFI99077.1 putative nuclease SbcCD, D subunit [Bifidobacterium stellenboschense]